MSENFFFNPGDSIASEYDFDSAYVAAQIYHKKVERPILITREKDGKPYFIFDEAAALAEEKAEAKRFEVVHRLR